MLTLLHVSCDQSRISVREVARIIRHTPKAYQVHMGPIGDSSISVPISSDSRSGEPKPYAFNCQEGMRSLSGPTGLQQLLLSMVIPFQLADRPCPTKESTTPFQTGLHMRKESPIRRIDRCLDQSSLNQ